MNEESLALAIFFVLRNQPKSRKKRLIGIHIYDACSTIDKFNFFEYTISRKVGKSNRTKGGMLHVNRIEK